MLGQLGFNFLFFNPKGVPAAALMGKWNKVRRLIKKGWNIDEYNAENETALMIACANRNHKLVYRLLIHGADPHVEDYRDITAYSYCEENICRCLLICFGYEPEVRENEELENTGEMKDLERRVKEKYAKYMETKKALLTKLCDRVAESITEYTFGYDLYNMDLFIPENKRMIFPLLPSFQRTIHLF